jgi:hypothetical protein
MCFYRLEEGFKGSSYLTETLLDLEPGHTFEPDKTALNKANKALISREICGPGLRLQTTNYILLGSGLP